MPGTQPTTEARPSWVPHLQHQLSPEQVLERLSRVDLLRALPPEEVQALVPYVQAIEVPAGETIFTQGAEGDALYLIEEGHARVHLDGGLEVATLGPGEVFGEMALLTGDRRSASLTAVTPLILWRLSREDFDQVVATSPQFAAALQEVAERNRAGLPLADASPSARRAWLGAAIRAFAARSLSLPGLRAAEGRILAAIERKRASRDVNRIHDESMTVGQRLADRIATVMGSWPFIIVQSTFLTIWVILNVTELIWKSWDPYPFILMNLMLSLQAAYAAPVIMMSQNRQSAKDRLEAELDLQTNLHAEALIEELHGRMEDLRLRQWHELVQMQEQQIEYLQRLLERQESGPKAAD
jgi:uncharacterized membrane protein